MPTGMKGLESGMATSRRAARRSTEEVRTLILSAANELFADRGYAQTSMRDIASRAGLSLSVLYRQFANKDELFAATLLAPFLASFEEFASAWSSQVDEPWEDTRLVGEFVRDLYANLVKYRHLVITLLAADQDSGSELLKKAQQGMADSLRDLRSMAEHEAGRRGWLPAESVADGNTLTIAMIGGLVLLQPLLAGASQVDEDTLIDAATRMALYGMRLGPR
jgi:AcrR family transcriptional regulator